MLTPVGSGAAEGGVGRPPVLHALIGASLPVRAILTVVLVAPSGVLMGVMVPSIVRILSEAQSPLVLWAGASTGRPA